MAGRTRPPYPAAFRAEAVALVRAGGRSLTQAAKDLGVHHETLRAWVTQADVDAGRRDGLTTENASRGWALNATPSRREANCQTTWCCRSLSRLGEAPPARERGESKE